MGEKREEKGRSKEEAKLGEKWKVQGREEKRMGSRKE